MNNRNNKMELLGNAPIPKALMAMGIPTMLGMMVNAIYNLVDAYFVGSLGTSQMGAISVVYPLGQVVVGLGLLFGNGSASYLSRLLGKGDKEKANQVASTALYSSITVGAIMIILSIIFLRPILKFLGATDSIMPYAITYASIYIISCIFNVFNVTMNNIVTSEGAAKTTMCGTEIRVLDEELAEALKQLPEQSRNIVLMFFFLDMSDSEIGEKLNINRSTSYRHRRNSLEEIRKQLKEKKTNEE